MTKSRARAALVAFLADALDELAAGAPSVTLFAASPAGDAGQTLADTIQGADLAAWLQELSAAAR